MAERDTTYHKQVHSWSGDTVSVVLPDEFHSYGIVEIKRQYDRPEDQPHRIFISGDDTAEALENACAAIKEALRAQQVSDLYTRTAPTPAECDEAEAAFEGANQRAGAQF